MPDDLPNEAASAPERPAKGRPRVVGRREEILRMAARVFSEHGFRQATLEDVASALNITRPALYHYAESKDQLLSECAAIAQDLLRQALEEAHAQPLGRDQLAAYFRRYAEIICDDFGRCFVLTDRRELSGENAETNRLNQRELSVAVQGMIVRGAEDGSLRKVDPADATHALYGAFNGIPRWYRPEGPRSPGELANDVLAVFLGGLDA